MRNSHCEWWKIKRIFNSSDYFEWTEMWNWMSEKYKIKMLSILVGDVNDAIDKCSMLTHSVLVKHVFIINNFFVKIIKTFCDWIRIKKKSSKYTRFVIACVKFNRDLFNVQQTIFIEFMGKKMKCKLFSLDFRLANFPPVHFLIT